MISGHALRQARRFALSGTVATGLHVAVATGLIVLLLTAPPVANAVAFVLASAFSYLINTLWSFSSTPSWRTLFRFILVLLVGSLVAFTASSIAQYYGFHYVVGFVLVVITAPPLTFLLHKVWTYSEPRSSR